MKKLLLVAFGLAVVLVYAAGTVAAQPPPIRGPGEPIGPPPIRGPREPIGPTLPGRGDSRNEIHVYSGVGTQSRVATISRSGGTWQMHSGGRGPVLITKRGNRVYDGQKLTIGSVIYTVMGGSIIPGLSTNPRNATCTIRGSRIFTGNSTQLADVKYTLKRMGRETRFYNGVSVSGLANVHFTVVGSLTSDNLPLVAILGGC